MNTLKQMIGLVLFAVLGLLIMSEMLNGQVITYYRGYPVYNNVGDGVLSDGYDAAFWLRPSNNYQPTPKVNVYAHGRPMIRTESKWPFRTLDANGVPQPHPKSTLYTRSYLRHRGLQELGDTMIKSGW
jgi:hypothetical protein